MGIDLRVQQILEEKASRDRELAGVMQGLKNLEVAHKRAEGYFAKMGVG